MQTTSIKLYMAFPDGVLHYVCAECTALCCRGQGLGGSLRKELPKLVQLYPAITTMASSRNGDFVYFSSPANACYLLEPDLTCRVEKQYGKALKPAVCRLFPFNSLTRIGDAIAVSPHYLCPLRMLLPAQPGQVHGTYTAVAEAVYESDLLECTYSHMKPVPLHASENAQSVLQREEAFRDRCSQSLGKVSFSSLLESEAKDPQALRDFMRRTAAIMGIDEPQRKKRRDDFDDLLLTLAPTLRLSYLRLSSEGILRALLLAELIGRRVMALSKEPLSLKGMYSIVSDRFPVIHMLAYGDEPITLAKSASTKLPEWGAPELIFAAFAAVREIERSSLILDALEKAIPTSLAAFDRAILLAHLGGQVMQPKLKRSRAKA